MSSVSKTKLVASIVTAFERAEARIDKVRPITNGTTAWDAREAVLVAFAEFIDLLDDAEGALPRLKQSHWYVSAMWAREEQDVRGYFPIKASE